MGDSSRRVAVPDMLLDAATTLPFFCLLFCIPDGFPQSESPHICWAGTRSLGCLDPEAFLDLSRALSCLLPSPISPSKNSGPPTSLSGFSPLHRPLGTEWAGGEDTAPTLKDGGQAPNAGTTVCPCLPLLSTGRLSLSVLSHCTCG